jgi:hypothetical protein
LRHLTRGWDESPAWSANGRRIAFERYFARIYTVDALGRGLRFVAQGSDPDWSPSGRSHSRRVMEPGFVCEIRRGTPGR